MKVNTLDFNGWVDKYTDYLFSIAYYKVSNREEAEDLVQETFLAAFKAKENFNGISTEKTWLTAILKNKIVDFYRRPKIVSRYPDYLEQTNESFEKSFFDPENHNRWHEKVVENYFSTSADGYLISKEFQSFLEICLEKMPSKIKAVFVSKYLDDANAENICKEFNITSSNYWVIIFRAKTLLRTCLVKKGLID